MKQIFTCFSVPVILCLLSACASDPPAATSAGVDSSTQICTYERELGSYIKKKVCRSARERERANRDAQEELNRPTVINEGMIDSQ